MDRLVIALLAFLLSSCTFSPQLHIHDADQQPLEVYEGEYIFTFTAQGPYNPYTPGVKDTTVLPAGVYTVDSVNNFNLVKVSMLKGQESKKVPYSPENDMCIQQNLPNCFPNYVVHTQQDPLESKQWFINYMHLRDEASKDINVAILDTGVDCNHDEIHCTKEFDARTSTEDKGAAQDDNGHGTHVAGIACANGTNDKGGRGVSEGCRITAIKFLSADGSGSVYNAIKGIEYAIKQKVDIINASFGGGGRLQPFQDAINRAYSDGIIFVAAAGNEHNNNDAHPSYPANYDHVISVASLEQNGKLSSFSNYGKKTVQVAAPGGNIFSTAPGNNYVALSGTSMASPAVAGLLAVLLQNSLDTFSDKKLRADAAVDTLFSSSIDKGFGPVVYGKAVREGTDTPTPPSCKAKKCKRCMNTCAEDFDCSPKKKRACKKDCRTETNCKKGCR